jgi:hypothetical protein
VVDLIALISFFVGPHIGGADEMKAWVAASRFVHGNQWLANDDPATGTRDARSVFGLAHGASATDLLRP